MISERISRLVSLCGSVFKTFYPGGKMKKFALPLLIGIGLLGLVSPLLASQRLVLAELIAHYG